MSYMNDDTDPFGVPYAPIRKQKPIKEIKEESTERFTYSGCIVYDKEETDDHRCKYGMNIPDTVRLLNQLSDENEQLKQTIDRLTLDNTKQKKVLNTTKKENEQLKQFKEKVFILLDKEITQNEEAIEWGEKQGADVGAMGFHTEMLKILRKELKE